MHQPCKAPPVSTSVHRYQCCIHQLRTIVFLILKRNSVKRHNAVRRVFRYIQRCEIGTDTNLSQPTITPQYVIRLRHTSRHRRNPETTSNRFRIACGVFAGNAWQEPADTTQQFWVSTLQPTEGHEQHRRRSRTHRESFHSTELLFVFSK